jgi:ATP-dependent DNA helicase RecG
MKITASRLSTLLADELGSGVRNLYHYVKIYSNAEPVFDEDDVFRLIVPLNDEYSADRAFAGELSQTDMTQKVNEESSPNRQSVGLDVGLAVGLESRVLNEVTANPRIKMSEIAVKYHVSKRTVERMFGKLSQDGRIVRVGGKRFGHWEIIG